MSLATVVAATQAKRTKKTAKKRSPKGKCVTLARKHERVKRELDDVEKQLASVKAADKLRHDAAAAKLKARQDKEHSTMDARHLKERDSLQRQFGCVPPPRPRAPRNKPTSTEAADPNAKKAPKKAPKKAAKKASKRTKPDASDEPAAKAPPPQPTKVSGAARWLQLPRPGAPVQLSVVVDGRLLQRALTLARRAHRPSGKDATKAYDLITFYVVASQLLLHVRANHGEFTIAVPTRSIYEVGVARVELAELREVKFDDQDDVSLVVEHGSLTIRQGPTTARFFLSREAPPDPVQGAFVRDAVIAPAILTRALDAVLYAAADGVGRPNLEGVYLERHTDDTTVFVATDGHRLVVHEDAVPWVAEESLVLDIQELRHLPKLLHRSEAARIGYTPSGGSCISIVALEGQLAWMAVLPERREEGKRIAFPSYRAVVPRAFTHVCSLSAKELRLAFKPLAARGKNIVVAGKPMRTHPLVRVVHEDGRLVLSRYDVDSGGASSSVATHCAPGDGIEFGIQPNYMLAAVTNGPIATSNAVALEYEADLKHGKPSVNPIKLSASGPGWSTTAIIMPLRM